MGSNSQIRNHFDLPSKFHTMPIRRAVLVIINFLHVLTGLLCNRDPWGKHVDCRLLHAQFRRQVTSDASHVRRGLASVAGVVQPDLCLLIRHHRGRRQLQ